MSSDPCRPTLVQIEHIALTTCDLARQCGFYRQLGAVVSPARTDSDTGLTSCVLDFCGIRIELFERPGSADAAGGGRSTGLIHIGFALGSADSVDELTSVLAAAGHRVLEPPHRTGTPGRYESVVLDPDGNRLKLTV